MAPLIAADPVVEDNSQSTLANREDDLLPVHNQSRSQTKVPQNFLQVAVTTFLTVFLAEIGDKTQLTTLMITAESKQPLVVFAGAGLALVLTSLLGAVAGKWLGEKVPPRILNLLAALSFLGLSISLVWDAVR